MTRFIQPLAVLVVLLALSACHKEPPTSEPPARKPTSDPASFLDAIQSVAADAIETHLASLLRRQVLRKA